MTTLPFIFLLPLRNASMCLKLNLSSYLIKRRSHYNQMILAIIFFFRYFPRISYIPKNEVQKLRFHAKEKLAFY